MKLSPICPRNRLRALLVLAAGMGLVLTPLGGCDPVVQDVVLGGMNELAVTLVDAVFLMFQTDEATTTTDVPETVEAITKAIAPILT